MTHRHFQAAAAIALLVLLGRAPVAAAPSSAPGVTFTVNSALDEVDAQRGDGVCSSKPSHKCTLRAAVQETNALGGNNTILLAAGAYSFTISGQNENKARAGDLDIKSDLTIKGVSSASTIIYGSQLDRVFDVFHSKLHLVRLTVNNGRTSGDGGNIRVRAGATLTVNHAEVIYGTSTNGGGGGIFNQGTVKFKNSILFGNKANGGDGGGLNNNHLAKFNRSEVRTNTAVDGGGLSNAAILTVNNSTLYDNSSIQDGGAVISTSIMHLTDSTVTRNTALAGNGGGVMNIGLADFFNVTLASNQAGDGKTGGGIFNVSSGGARLRNTLLDSNTVVQSTPPFFYFNDCAGSLASEDYNLVSDGGCSLSGGAHDKLGINAGLDVLLNAGGPTPTMPLLPGSPAIDGGNPQGCRDLRNVSLTTDQRGSPRPVDGDGNGKKRCDIGAFEVQP